MTAAGSLSLTCTHSLPNLLLRTPYCLLSKSSAARKISARADTKHRLHVEIDLQIKAEILTLSERALAMRIDSCVGGSKPMSVARVDARGLEYDQTSAGHFHELLLYSRPKSAAQRKKEF